MGWQDLVRDSATDIGRSAIANLGNQIRTSGNPTSDHIPAQNETGARFAQTLAAYNAGQISADQARAEINQWNNAFLLLTQQIGSARALRGGSEINALAQRILTSLGGPTGQGTVIPPTGTGGVPYHPPGTIVIGGQVMSTTTLLMLGAVAVFMLTRKR
jgi:hypothetical protein